MKRADCLGALYPELGDRLVVTIMGATAQELYDLGHRETFFYLQHAMGLASSIGLGLALNRPDAGVVVLDGDGFVLMNLGGLATLGRYRPPNLTHVIFEHNTLQFNPKKGEELLTREGLEEGRRGDLGGSSASAPHARHHRLRVDGPRDLAGG